jgi:hypothetical protein
VEISDDYLSMALGFYLAVAEEGDAWDLESFCSSGS